MTIQYYLPIFIAIGIGVAAVMILLTFLKWLDIRTIKKHADTFNKLQNARRTKLFDIPESLKMSKAFFKSFPKPVILVDQEGTIKGLNDLARVEYAKYAGQHIHRLIPTFYTDEPIDFDKVPIRCVSSEGDVMEGVAIIMGDVCEHGAI